MTMCTTTMHAGLVSTTLLVEKGISVLDNYIAYECSSLGLPFLPNHTV